MKWARYLERLKENLSLLAYCKNCNTVLELPWITTLTLNVSGGEKKKRAKKILENKHGTEKVENAKKQDFSSSLNSSSLCVFIMTIFNVLQTVPFWVWEGKWVRKNNKWSSISFHIHVSVPDNKP